MARRLQLEVRLACTGFSGLMPTTTMMNSVVCFFLA
jgi:hypothetical protein